MTTNTTTDTNTLKDGIPVVAGFIETHDQGHSLRVWCRWCCTWHDHGLADANPGDYTHRVGHCYAPDSTYNRAGYWILVTDTPYSIPRKTMRQASTSQRAAIMDGRISAAVQRLRGQQLPIG